MLLVKTKFLGMAVMLLGLTACDFHHDKLKADDAGEEAPITNEDLSYANVNAKVLGPYCLTCHTAALNKGGGYKFESYQQVKSKISLIEADAITDRVMPPDDAPALPAGAYDLLKQWIEAGAPETAPASN